VQLQDLKLFKENFSKEIEKIQDKYNKSKERSKLLERGIVKVEAEKREVELNYIRTYNDILKRHENLNKEHEGLKKINIDLIKQVLDITTLNEEYKSKLEEYMVDIKELTNKCNMLKTREEICKSE
jgi:hypothetical protein